MNRKLISILSISMMLLFAILFSFSKPENQRYHQHLEKKQGSLCKHDVNLLCTHLPLLSIDTKGVLLTQESEEEALTKSEIRIFDEENSNHHLSDAATLSSMANIRYRGNSSRSFDKKSLLIKLVDKKGLENKQVVMGMPEHNEWVLHGPFLDKSLIRNYMSMNLAGEIMDYAPQVRFCELVFNEEYQGLYVMMESIARGEHRVNIAKHTEQDPFPSYIVRLDRGGSGEENINNFTHYTYNTPSIVNVVYPSKNTLNPEVLDDIERDLSIFEKALYSYDYSDKKLGYRSYIDVLSFVDYLIINEFSQNYDAGIYSTYLYKDVKGKLFIGPVWDYNNAYDNYMENTFDGTGFAFHNKTWYFMLMKDPYFIDLVIERYKQLRKTVLSEEYLMNYIEETILYLGDAVDRNFAVWGYSFKDEYGLLEPAQRNIQSHDEAIKQLKDFVKKRGNWLDDYIDILKQYCHESKNKKFNH